MDGFVAGNGDGRGYISSVMAYCENGCPFFAIWYKSIWDKSKFLKSTQLDVCLDVSAGEETASVWAVAQQRLHACLAEQGLTNLTANLSPTTSPQPFQRRIPSVHGPQ